MKRELLPEEVAEIAALAADFADLRMIRPMVAELQHRLNELGEVKLDAVFVRPTSVKDLIELLKAGVVTIGWVQARLPGGAGMVMPVAEEGASSTNDRDAIVATPATSEAAVQSPGADHDGYVQAVDRPESIGHPLIVGPAKDYAINDRRRVAA